MFWIHNSISDSLQIRIKKEQQAAHKHSRTMQVHRLRCTETSHRQVLVGLAGTEPWYKCTEEFDFSFGT